MLSQDDPRSEMTKSPDEQRSRLFVGPDVGVGEAEVFAYCASQQLTCATRFLSPNLRCPARSGLTPSEIENPGSIAHLAKLDKRPTDRELDVIGMGSNRKYVQRRYLRHSLITRPHWPRQVKGTPVAVASPLGGFRDRRRLLECNRVSSSCAVVAKGDNLTYPSLLSVFRRTSINRRGYYCAIDERQT